MPPNPKKVLFVAGGRRVSLAERFIAHGFQVFAYETEVRCPIALVGTVVEGLKWNNPEIENHLLKTINELEVDLVIPLADQATSLLSKLVEKYSELAKKVPTSSLKTNNICLNKKLFEKEFGDQEYYPRVKEGERVIAKPIQGANSKGIQIMEYWEEYGWKKYCWEDEFVCQRYVDGIEISVDCYFDKNGKFVDGCPRLRLEVQGGEVCRSITLAREAYGVVKLAKEIGERIRLVGPVCAQFIIDREEDKAYVMEVNARMGGGLILSEKAGLPFIDLIEREYLEGKEIENYSSQWKENFGMVRYFKEYYYER